MVTCCSVWLTIVRQGVPIWAPEPRWSFGDHPVAFKDCSTCQTRKRTHPLHELQPFWRGLDIGPYATSTRSLCKFFYHDRIETTLLCKDSFREQETAVRWLAWIYSISVHGLNHSSWTSHSLICQPAARASIDVHLRTWSEMIVSTERYITVYFIV